MYLICLIGEFLTFNILQKSNNTYLVKKGAADPFRGDWYILDEEFNSAEEAISTAAEKTLAQYKEYNHDWEQYGYEWSVFEKSENVEKKIWEGYKYIKSAVDGNLDLKMGSLP